jgi:hypothetical protein
MEPGAQIDVDGFRSLMRTVADGWNRGDARKAADCFSADVRYGEPPDRQFYQGQEQLFAFFGGELQTPPNMRMTWHHLVFDEADQIGAGEYTFEGGRRYHGVAVVKIVQGRIAFWREYQYESPLDWDDFTARVPF